MRPLLGRSVVTTRERRGPLDSRLALAGADVIHVPLIAVAEPTDRGTALRDALCSVDTYDWLVVTSVHGAARIGAAAARHPHVRLAAVGSRTAEALTSVAGRAVDVVPERQTGAALASSLPDPAGRVLVAQAEVADSGLVDGLVGRGADVTVVAAYRTVARAPTWRERRAALAADALTLASGSAAAAWVSGVGPEAPPVVAAIGPTTAAAAEEHGLKVTHVAADHDVDGLVAVTTMALAPPS